MSTQQLVSSDDLDTSKMRYLVDGILPEVGQGYVWGPPGSSKSALFGMELGLACANGVNWMGRATRKGTVIYCLGEGLPGQGIRKQARLARQARDDTEAIARAAMEQGDEAARELAASLPAYTGTGLKIMVEPFDMRLTAKGEISASMREAIDLIKAEDEPPSLVICDAAGDFTGGAGLSSDSVANHFAAGLKALGATLDCCVVVIAHPTAANTKMLGAGRLVAAADFVFEVQPDTAAAPGAAMTSTISCRKQKDGSKAPDFGIETLKAEWDQPVTDDETGEETGETEHVESITVRLLEASGQDSGPRPQPAAPLPVLAPERADARRSKRSGLRRHSNPAGLHSVPDAAATRAAMVRGILSVDCSECSRPRQVGCDTVMKGCGRLIPLSMDGGRVLASHEDRIIAAAIAGAVDLDEVLAALAA